MKQMIYERWTSEFHAVVVEIAESDSDVKSISLSHENFVIVRYSNGSMEYVPWSQIKNIRRGRENG